VGSTTGTANRESADQAMTFALSVFGGSEHITIVLVQDPEYISIDAATGTVEPNPFPARHDQILPV
jgi:hypothetical protein